MLKGMGWQEGAGLGATGEGISAPIDDGGQLDKVGVGLRNQKSGSLDGFFEAYRSERSGTYHRKISDR
jgi:hypothetical protein